MYFSRGNSITNEANKIGRYAGPALPSPIFNETNQMTLHFVSDQLVSGKGFDISYCSNEAGCGGDLSGTHGNVYMTGFPVVRFIIYLNVFLVNDWQISEFSTSRFFTPPVFLPI